jgi:hypothetical protein
MDAGDLSSVNRDTRDHDLQMLVVSVHKLITHGVYEVSQSDSLDISTHV